MTLIECVVSFLGGCVFGALGCAVVRFRSLHTVQNPPKDPEMVTLKGQVEQLRADVAALKLSRRS